MSTPSPAVAVPVATARMGQRSARTSPPAAWQLFMRQRPALVGMILVLLLFVVAVLAPILTPYDPLRANNTPFLAPGLADRHYFGTTAVGRDLFSALAYGARVSLTVGLVVALLSTLGGILVGSVAGYSGGWIDDALMRFTELFIIIPRFFLALVVVAIYGHNLLNMIIVLAILSWPPVARVVRADYLSLKQREFVQSARLIGASHMRIILREILPNALGPAVVVGSLQVSQAILTEASLAFLGLGDPDLPSWGDLLVDAQRFLTRAPWLALFPGLAITCAVVGFNLMGDGLSRALDPRTAQQIQH
jgi:peptide/nickel transport system permease protein